MISSQQLYEKLASRGITFFTGVPDSLLKEFCRYLSKNLGPQDHVIAANEGNAVAMATGYHLSTGKFPLVYMQNSGLGNAINPLTSLTNREVYSIPLLLLIGWRGEASVQDEPQHKKMGEITPLLLEAMNIPFAVLPKNFNELDETLGRALRYLNDAKTPYALLAGKGTLEKELKPQVEAQSLEISREEAIRQVIRILDSSDVVVSTTGKISRELFEIREETALPHSTDFLTVGSMGHCCQIALGIALTQPQKTVYCLDGDGSVLMHMGGLPVIGTLAPGNFKHIVLNNGAHESVGGQPTAGLKIDLCGVAISCRYKNISRVRSTADLEKELLKFKAQEGPSFLEIQIRQGSRPDLGRPTVTPGDQKRSLMRFLHVNRD